MRSGIPDRRQFLGAMATLGAVAAAGKDAPLNAAGAGSAPRWPKLVGSPVLDSLHPVIDRSRDVRTNVDKIIEVAGWMAYEELPMPDYTLPSCPKTLRKPLLPMPVRGYNGRHSLCVKSI